MRLRAAHRLRARALIAWALVALAAPIAAAAPDRNSQAFALLERGEAARAADEFEALLELDSRDALSVEGRIRSLLALDRWREALDEARRHAQRLDDAPRARVALGEALYRAGRFEEIEDAVGDLARGVAATGRALALMGRLREAEGRGGEAVRWMAAAAEAAPQDRDVQYWSAGAAVSRAETAERLRRYLQLSEGDDPDRIESARGWLRLMEQLGERSVWIDERRPERVELPLTRLWDPATGVLQGFVVSVGLGQRGRRVPLLLDSGSPGLFVIRRVAKKREFAPLAEQTAFGGGGKRSHRSTRGMFPSVSIGELKFREALATSNKQELDPTGRFRGLLGLSPFNGYRVTLDLEDDRLLLEPSDAQGTGTTYWTVGGQLLVRAEVGGSESGLFLLDTGATRTMVDAGLAARVAGARSGRPVEVRGFGGQIRDVRGLDGVEIRFLGRSSDGAALRVLDLSTRSRLGGVEISGFIGLDLLAGHRVIVDSRLRTVRIE